MPLLEQFEYLFGDNPHMQRVLALMYSDILMFHKNALRFFTERGKYSATTSGACVHL